MLIWWPCSRRDFFNRGYTRIDEMLAIGRCVNGHRVLPLRPLRKHASRPGFPRLAACGRSNGYRIYERYDGKDDRHCYAQVTTPLMYLLGKLILP